MSQESKTTSTETAIGAIAIFDIDGVIRDVGGSYRRALADTVEEYDIANGPRDMSSAQYSASTSPNVCKNVLMTAGFDGHVTRLTVEQDRSRDKGDVGDGNVHAKVENKWKQRVAAIAVLIVKM